MDRTFRQSSGWMHCALTVFDDTEVTIALVIAGADSFPAFELFVENHAVAARATSDLPGTVKSSGADVASTLRIVELRVPIEFTRGHTNVLVALRAVGAHAPRIVEIRSVLDHNE